MKKYLTTLTAYNLWANERMMSFIKNLDDKLMSEIVESSFPSIRETVLHVWDAEFLWLERILKAQEEYDAIDWPSKDFSGDRNDLINGMLDTSRAFNNYVLLNDDLVFSLPVRYKNTKGEEFEQAPGLIIMHCMNHSTFHRGQLITMMRRLGATEFKSTDMIAYFREMKISAIE